MGVHGHAVGVDFGTSTSLVAARAGRLPVEVVPLGRTTRSFPSIAGFRGEQLLVGEDTDDLSGDAVIRSAKRAITQNLETLSVAGRRIPADEVITALLAEIGRRAEAVDQPLSMARDLRLGCPAMWDGAQRQRLLGLAEKAGFPIDETTLVDEPIAAGIAWVMNRSLFYGERLEGRLLVFDMGGGTLDIAVLDVLSDGPGTEPEISVLSALGAELAGDKLDQAIAGDLTSDLAAQGHSSSSARRPELFTALVLRAARDAKIALSQRAEHRIMLPSRQLGQLPMLTYTREKLEEAFRPQMDIAEALVWAALRASRLTVRDNRSAADLRVLTPEALRGDVDYVLLAGGMSRIPYVERRLGALFPGAQVFDNAGVQPDEAIVAGLADTISYRRLNLHRPGFDFIIEWEEGGQLRQEILYPAHTPFYSPQQVLSGQSDLGFARHDRDFPGPRSGSGRLRVRSTSGEYLGLAVDNQTMDGLVVRFGNRMDFKLYCDGRILIRDGSGRALHMRVDRWPVIRGRDSGRLQLRSAVDREPIVPTGWYMDKEYAPPIR
ncbi:Hsp70 family protein [Actinoplanes sp. NBC_00393]|uniref:Hsp70 family protein n=1 Tax=Actinoplanes sp. NBC_00393 TaxID=2975953 RepID=UPI002E1B550D